MNSIFQGLTNLFSGVGSKVKDFFSGGIIPSRTINITPESTSISATPTPTPTSVQTPTQSFASPPPPIIPQPFTITPTTTPTSDQMSSAFQPNTGFEDVINTLRGITSGINLKTAEFPSTITPLTSPDVQATQNKIRDIDQIINEALQAQRVASAKISSEPVIQTLIDRRNQLLNTVVGKNLEPLVAQRQSLQEQLTQQQQALQGGLEMAKLQQGASADVLSNQLKALGLIPEFIKLGQGATTNDISEYNLALRQGFKGSFIDYQQERGVNRFQPVTTTDAFGNPVFKVFSTRTGQFIDSGVSSSSQVQIPSNAKEYQDVMNFLVSKSIPSPSQRRDIRGTLGVILSQGDTQSAKEYLRDTAIESGGEAAQKLAEGSISTLRSLEETDKLLDDMKAEGINTNILRGGIENVARFFGETTDPKLVRFQSRMKQILFDYRRAATGVQFSLAESNQYNKLFSDITNQFNVNKALVSGLKDQIEITLRNYFENRLGSKGYNLIKDTILNRDIVGSTSSGQTSSGLKYTIQ